MNKKRVWALLPILLAVPILFTQPAFSAQQSFTVSTFNDFYWGAATNASFRSLGFGRDLLEKEVALDPAYTNCAGALATDGEFLYAKCWGDYGGGTSSGGLYKTRLGKFRLTGEFVENIAELDQINKSLAVAYLNGYVYNGYTDNGYVIEKVDVSNGAVNFIGVPSGLVCRNKGTVGTCGTGLLITSDGQYLYNLAYNTSGMDGRYYGWRIKKFDQSMNLVDEFTINQEGYYIDGIVCNGSHIFALEWTYTPDARVVTIDLVSHQIAGITRFEQYPLAWIGGQYDPVSGKVWLGDLFTNKAYRLSLSAEGMALDVDSTAANEVPVDNVNMILYFKMNGKVSAEDTLQNEFDYTATPNNGTKSGKADILAGKFAGAREFDGAGDYITTQPSAEFDSLQSFTAEMWVKFSDVSTVQSVFSAWYNDSERVDLSFVPGTGFVLLANVTGNNDNATTIARREVQSGQWYQVVLRADHASKYWSLFVNGRLLNSTRHAISFDNVPDGWNVTFGSARPYSGSYDFNGMMDQVVVYKTALTNNVIQENYIRGRKMFPRGQYVSKIFEMEKPTTWDNLSWEWFSPKGDTSVDYRTSDHSDSSWQDWNPYSGPSSTPLNVSAKYIQFRATLTTPDANYPTGVSSFRLDYQAPDVVKPEITLFEISPKVVYAGRFVNITVNATDASGISAYVLNITYPWGGYETVSGVDKLNRSYNLSLQNKGDGMFSVNATVRDPAGNENSMTMSFQAMNATKFSVNVTNRTGSMPATVTLYYPGTMETVEEYNASNGAFVGKDAPDYSYDMVFIVLNGKLMFMLKNVNLSLNLNRKVSFDVFNGSIIYYINSTYISGDGGARLSYDGTTMNESRLRVFRCDYWLASSGRCATSMNATNSTQNTDGNYFDVAGLGPLVSNPFWLVIQESWCGDGTCTSEYENNAACPEDCESDCTEGEKRLCSISHYGVCASGNETCVGGSWTGCLAARTTEACNGKDDDCDGVIDNIRGGNSTAATNCRCYAGGTPAQEACNGVDDDCDGQIDEGSDCCQEGDSRDCGQNVGECQYGKRYCMNGIWGADCIGGVEAEPTDVCGDHRDNNCDGEIDEGCDHCSNRLQDYDEEGVDCGGNTCNACAGFPYWVLIVVGAVIIGMVLFLMKALRKEGKDLTWEEIKKRYTPAEQ